MTALQHAGVDPDSYPSTKSSEHYGCLLDVDSMKEIIRIAVESMGGETETEIHHRPDHGGNESLVVATLDELFVQLCHPGEIGNLYISINSFAQRKCVTLRISGKNPVELSVQGRDEVWIRRLHDGLASRLNASKKPLAMPFRIGILLTSLPVAPSMIVYSAAVPKGSGMAFSITLWVIAALFAAAMARRRKSALIIVGYSRAWDKMNVFTVVITLLGAVIAIAAAWISWQAWQHPVE
jgi:hypothetical protein